MKKIKKNDEQTFQDPYQFVIATPLNTDMFKEPEVPSTFKEPEHSTTIIPEQYFEPDFVLPKTVEEDESHFVLPKTPPPIPTLSPIPEPEQNTYLQQIEQEQTQNIYEQLLQQTTVEQQQFLTNEIDGMSEQNMIQQFLTQQHETTVYETNMCEEQFLTQQHETKVNETNMCEEEVEEEEDIVMTTIAEVINNPGKNRTGKNITMLKRHYALQEEEEEEEEEEELKEEEEKEEELRTTTKNNKRFHKHLILKKKDEVIKKFPILSQKNNDLIVTAENKYKELKSIFILKKKYVEKNKQLKEHIYGLELIEHRYRTETERLNKKKKKWI